MGIFRFEASRGRFIVRTSEKSKMRLNTLFAYAVNVGKNARNARRPERCDVARDGLEYGLSAIMAEPEHNENKHRT